MSHRVRRVKCIRGLWGNHVRTIAGAAAGAAWSLTGRALPVRDRCNGLLSGGQKRRVLDDNIQVHLVGADRGRGNHHARCTLSGRLKRIFSRHTDIYPCEMHTYIQTCIGIHQLYSRISLVAAFLWIASATPFLRFECCRPCRCPRGKYCFPIRSLLSSCRCRRGYRPRRISGFGPGQRRWRSAPRSSSSSSVRKAGLMEVQWIRLGCSAPPSLRSGVGPKQFDPTESSLLKAQTRGTRNSSWAGRERVFPHLLPRAHGRTRQPDRTLPRIVMPSGTRASAS